MAAEVIPGARRVAQRMRKIRTLLKRLEDELNMFDMERTQERKAYLQKRQSEKLVLEKKAGLAPKVVTIKKAIRKSPWWERERLRQEYKKIG